MVGKEVGRKLWAGTPAAPAANVTLPPPPPPPPSSPVDQPSPAPPAPARTPAMRSGPVSADDASAATPAPPSGSHTTAIIGGSVGGVIALVAIAVVISLLIARNRRKLRKQSVPAPDAQQTPGSVSAREPASHSAISGASIALATRADGHASNRTTPTSSLQPGIASSCQRSSVQPTLSAFSTDTRKSTPAGAQSAATRVRIAPATSAKNGDSAVVNFSNATLVLPHTLGEPEEWDRLRNALTNMATAEPVQLFAGRYRLKAERPTQGGQALVAFACDRADSFFQYAIKCALVCIAHCDIVFQQPSLSPVFPRARAKRGKDDLTLLIMHMHAPLLSNSCLQDQLVHTGCEHDVKITRQHCI